MKTKKDSYKLITCWARTHYSLTDAALPAKFGENVYRFILEEIASHLLDEGRVALPGDYGTIYLAKIPARNQRGPNGHSIEIAGREEIRFSAGGTLRRRIGLRKNSVNSSH